MSSASARSIGSPGEVDCRLVADIGGTHARFGIARGSALEVTDVRVMRCADFATPQDAALAYLQALGLAGTPRRPARAAWAVACAIGDGPLQLTNGPWRLEHDAIASALGLSELVFLNDFEAVARSLPWLGPGDLRRIGAAEPDRRLPMAAVGPGTGLGVALCLPRGDGWQALSTEGGHMTASAADDFEADVLRQARSELEHVSAERLLSGIGLPVLYRAVARVRGQGALDLGAESITARARAGTDPVCSATVDVFFAMLGSFAGNVALCTGARGGLFLAGGIALALADLLDRSRFRERFEAKGRFREYLRPIATCLVTSQQCALVGAARALGAP